MLYKNSLWKIINWFKWRCKFEIGKVYKKLDINDPWFLWQPNYYDRIIRNEDELIKVRNYISNNPLKWEQEKNENIWIFM